jgi:hypothetical protein
LEFAQFTKDKRLSAVLIEKAADLKARADQVPEKPDILPDSTRRSARRPNSLANRRSERIALDELPIILGVEDDEPIQDIIKHAATDAGFDLMVSASGDEALTPRQRRG